LKPEKTGNVLITYASNSSSPSNPSPFSPLAELCGVSVLTPLHQYDESEHYNGDSTELK